MNIILFLLLLLKTKQRIYIISFVAITYWFNAPAFVLLGSIYLLKLIENISEFLLA